MTTKAEINDMADLLSQRLVVLNSLPNADAKIAANASASSQASEALSSIMDGVNHLNSVNTELLSGSFEVYDGLQINDFNINGNNHNVKFHVFEGAITLLEILP